MDILFYISTIRGGGAARVMTNLANQFAKNEHKVILVTNFQTLDEYTIEHSIHRENLDGKKESKKGFILKNIQRVVGLRHIIKMYRPQIVISFMHENDIRAFISTRGINVKLLLSVRNDPSRLYNNSKLKHLIAKYTYSHADGVVFQTNQAMNYFGKIKNSNAIIYNQVSEKFFSIIRNGQSEKDIIAVGKFLPQKNHMMLLRAFSLICDEIEENLVIYGDGPLRSTYEDFIKEHNMEERVFLPGICADIPHVLEKAKLFVLSSDYEGMPNALMEAMAAGVPCISTDCPCGGPKELLGKINEKVLVEVGNVTQLAEVMKTIICSDEFRKEYSKNLKEISTVFYPDKIFNQWKEYILMLVEETE